MTELPRVSQETVVREPLSAADITEDLYDALDRLGSSVRRQVFVPIVSPVGRVISPRRLNRFGLSFLVSESMTRNIRAMRNA